MSNAVIRVVSNRKILKEAAYAGNIGIMELIKFKSNATPEQKKKFDDADSKEHLAILTSRAFKKAKQVAENAARGSFPSSKPVRLPNYDFDDVYDRLRAHYKTLKPR